LIAELALKFPNFSEMAAWVDPFFIADDSGRALKVRPGRAVGSE
jgi:hypothetical protein